MLSDRRRFKSDSNGFHFFYNNMFAQHNQPLLNQTGLCFSFPILFACKKFTSSSKFPFPLVWMSGLGVMCTEIREMQSFTFSRTCRCPPPPTPGNLVALRWQKKEEEIVDEERGALKSVWQLDLEEKHESANHGLH